jgi:hypothetical protein
LVIWRSDSNEVDTKLRGTRAEVYNCTLDCAEQRKQRGGEERTTNSKSFHGYVRSKVVVYLHEKAMESFLLRNEYS